MLLGTVLALMALLAAGPAAAQARYQAQPDTLWYEGVNPYRMYVVRGADTVGTPVRSVSIERQTWSDSAGVLVVREHSTPLDVSGSPKADAARFTPRGLPADGPPTSASVSAVPLLLRLPADGDLRPGRAWADTIDETAALGGSDFVYQLTHTLRVEQVVDTLGARMAVIRGSGRLRYRQGAPADAAGPPAWWLDVAGPVDETFLFDVDRGRVAESAWWMDLRGTSGVPDGAGAADTLPAGLLSMDTTRLVTAERARLLSRALPAGDTSVTIGVEGDLRLHTVRPSGARLDSGMRGKDGATVTVQARHEDSRPVRYALLATEAGAEPLRRTVELRGASLVVSGGRDTTLAVPSGAWTIGEYGMDEQIAGAVARLGVDGVREGELHVLRTIPLRWDRAHVRLIPVRDAFLAVVRVEPEGIRDASTVLLVDKGGELLYAEGTSPLEFVRRPPAGSARHKRVEALFQAARAQVQNGP